MIQKIAAKQTGARTVLINEKRLVFPEEVLQVISTIERVFVLTNSFEAPYIDADRARNIFAYDTNSELLWRIEDAGFTSLGKDGQKVPQGYTGMDLEDGELKAFQPIGCDCTIDKDTGKIIAEELTR